jgi:hypothetical protein
MNGVLLNPNQLSPARKGIKKVERKKETKSISGISRKLIWGFGPISMTRHFFESIRLKEF